MTVFPAPPPGHQPLRFMQTRSQPQASARSGPRGRNGEVLMRTHRHGQITDQFDIPRHLQDPNWHRVWARASCHGKDDFRNMQVMYESGYRPVHPDTMQGAFPVAEGSDCIQYDGLVLLERPMELEREAQAEMRQEARRQKHNQASDFAGVDKMLAETPGKDAYFQASNADNDSRGVARPKLVRDIEGIPDKFYPKHELAIGDED